MKIQVDSGISGTWAKVNKDIRDGDRLKILDAGQVQQGQFGEQYIFKIMTLRKEEFNLALNRTSRNNLARGYSADTEDWVGKVAKAFVVKQMVGEGLKNVLYLAPDGWTMNDDGEFSNPNEEKEETPEREEIGPDPVPF